MAHEANPDLRAASPDPRRLAQELLARRCQRGERAAWETLVAEWQAPLFYYVRRLVRTQDDAWAVLQDVWLRVFTSLPTLRDPARLAAWLYGIARRAVADQHGAIAVANEFDAASVPDPRDDETAGADPERLHAALAALPTAAREVLALFFLEDLTLAEIAEVLEIPVGTVKSRLNHARGLLRESLTRLESRHG